jgi:hypothetical protein
MHPRWHQSPPRFARPFSEVQRQFVFTSISRCVSCPVTSSSAGVLFVPGPVRIRCQACRQGIIPAAVLAVTARPELVVTTWLARTAIT